MRPYCLLCPGQGDFLGALGRARWYRCRDCGYLFTKLARRRKT